MATEREQALGQGSEGESSRTNRAGLIDSTDSSFIPFLIHSLPDHGWIESWYHSSFRCDCLFKESRSLNTSFETRISRSRIESRHQSVRGSGMQLLLLILLLNLMKGAIQTELTSVVGIETASF